MKKVLLTAISLMVSALSFSQITFDGNGQKEGFRGFANIGYGIKCYGHSDQIELSAIGGYQFNPYIFVGAGVEGQYFTASKRSHEPTWDETYNAVSKDHLDDKHFNFPLFADVRVDWFNNTVSPFIDCRVGACVGDMDYRFYFSPSFGCRYTLSEHLSLNASVGYQHMKVAKDSPYYQERNDHVVIRVGIGF